MSPETTIVMRDSSPLSSDASSAPQQRTFTAGAWMRATRRAHAYSYEDSAPQLGVEPAHLTRWE
jgi:hypothetical protein